MKKILKSFVIRKLNKKVAQLLSSHQLKIVIVTGSVGKSSAKIAIGQLLQSKYRVNFSEDSYNTNIGLPLGLFGLKVPARLWDARAWDKIFRRINTLIADYPYDVVVLEVADDERKMMEPIVSKLAAKISVITGVAPVHMERMASMDKIVDDSWALGNHADEIIYNADFKELREKAKGRSNISSYGIKYGDLKFRQIKRQTNGLLKAEIKLGGKTKIISTQHVSSVGLYSLLAASAVGLKLGMNEVEIASSLEGIGPVNGRLNLLAGDNGVKLIDDSYNSSSEAAKAALATLSEFKGRKIAVLGSMNELGDFSSEAHSQVGKAAARVVDLLVVVGKEAERYLVPAAIQAGLSKSRVKVFRDPYVAGHFLKTQLKPGDVVLVKGSQDGVYVEEVTRILLPNDVNPHDVLVRQSASWRRRKKRAFRT